VSPRCPSHRTPYITDGGLHPPDARWKSNPSTQSHCTTRPSITPRGIVNKKCESIAAMTASERLNAACFRMVNKNSYSQVNCKYSHDKARKRQANGRTYSSQTRHAGQAPRDNASIRDGLRQSLQARCNQSRRRPQNPEFAPHISLLTQSCGPRLDEHIGREHECFQRIALLSQRIPASILSHGCQTEIVLLCTTVDLVVKAMLDTGCSPGNYMSRAFNSASIDALCRRKSRSCNIEFIPTHYSASNSPSATCRLSWSIPLTFRSPRRSSVRRCHRSVCHFPQFHGSYAGSSHDTT